jgi:hypothetical protein
VILLERRAQELPSEKGTQTEGPGAVDVIEGTETPDSLKKSSISPSAMLICFGPFQGVLSLDFYT